MWKKIKFDYFGVVFAILAILLNSHKNILCWPSYMLANIFMLIHFAPKKEYPYLFLLITYFCLNIYAWIEWASI